MTDDFDDAIALANGRPTPPARREGERAAHGTVPQAPVENATADHATPTALGPARDHGADAPQDSLGSSTDSARTADTPPKERTGAAPPDAPDGDRAADTGASFDALLPEPGHGAPHAPDWAAARDTAHHTARPLPSVPCRLEEALGQTLAAPLPALTDLPAFDTAAMDGWAVAGPGPWHLGHGQPGDRADQPTGGTDQGPTPVLAGGTTPPPLSDGLAVPIATGARVPTGTTAVLRSEHGTVIAGQLRGANPAPGTDIRSRGQECRSGTELLPAGEPVTPAVLGLAAAAGYDRLAVHPRPRVEVLVLGDELLREGLPKPGRVRDALGPMAGPWLTALGADVLVTRHLGDSAEALNEAVTTTGADLLVTTGSTAAGPADLLRPVLDKTGAQLVVDGVAVRPGHPMLLAQLRNGPPLIGLPGNPLAAVTGILTLAEPLLRALAGRLPATLPTAIADGEIRTHRRDTRIVPVRRVPGPPGAPVRVRPLEYAGPAMLRGVAGADALAVVAPGSTGRGCRVRLLDLPGT